MTDTSNTVPPHPANRCPGKSLLVVVGVSLLTLIVFTGIAEIYLRLTVPFITTSWPERFDPRYGTVFVPGEVLQWNNDYKSETVTAPVRRQPGRIGRGMSGWSPRRLVLPVKLCQIH